MGFFQAVKNFFKRSKYAMTTDTLTSVIDHPKIAVTAEEYQRIQRNLQYYQSRWDLMKYVNSNGEKKVRDKNHLPIGRTAAKKIASLVFNEQAEIVLDDHTAHEFVSAMLTEDRFNKNFERYLESCLALGGLAMRPYVDGERVRVSFIQAPVFLPLQSNTQDISEAAIVTKAVRSEGKENSYYTLFEFHEWLSDGRYQITNELYKSKQVNQVGSRVPLRKLYEDLKEVVTIAPLSRPLFTYLKPPGMNNKDINSPLGLSIFDNAKTTIDFINTTYDEFMWEVKMGQRRVVVPEQTVRLEFTGQGEQVFAQPKFDPEQNIFMQVNGGKEESGIGITDLTTPIRSDDYVKAINEGLALFEMQIGVSAGMFTFDGKSLKTATEVVSENSDTYQMRNSIVSLVEQSIKELVISICELGKAFGLYSGAIPSMDSISVNLDDGVFTDKNNELDYWTKALAAGLVTRSYAIQKALGLSEDDAAEMVASINAETVDQAGQVRSLTDLEIYGE